MKKILTLIGIAFFTLTSCSSDGEMGPPGPQGPPGEPGEDGLIGTVFETDPLDFTSDNDYSIVIDIPSNIEIFDSDVILVYILEAVNESGADIWTLLPQTFYLDGGQLVYNFNYTSDNVAIYLDGTIDRSTLDSAYSDDQIFRIVVIPAGFIESSSVDVSNYNAVMSALKVQEGNVPTLDSSKIK